MSITIVKDFPGYQLYTKQPMPIILHTDEDLDDQELRVELQIGLPEGLEVLNVYIREKPDLEGNVYFDLAALLDDYMDEPVKPVTGVFGAAIVTKPLNFSL